MKTHRARAAFTVIALTACTSGARTRGGDPARRADVAVARDAAGAGLPRWRGAPPVAAAAAGTTARLWLRADGAAVSSQEGERAVADADAAAREFDAALRGYRRREGLRRDPSTGELARGGNGTLEVTVVADASLPLARLRDLARDDTYSQWTATLALSARAGDVEVAAPFALRPRDGALRLRATATFQDLADVLSRADAPRGRPTVTIE